MYVYHNNIPTYDCKKKKWSTTSFKTQDDFVIFLESIFKEPGEYEFDETVHQWQEHLERFKEEGTYTLSPEGTGDYWDFWEKEELKNRLGVIWKNGKKTWYLPRDYYFLLNYCPIINKEKGNDTGWLQIRDVQYHMMLYEKIAEAKHLYSCILKRRQMAFSLCHSAKLLNFLWFENDKTLKMFASDEAYLDKVNGSWKMIDKMREHLNEHTPWERGFSPEEYPKIQQKEKIQYGTGTRWKWEGNGSTLVAKTLKRDPTSGVGGTNYWVWYEEGGVAPKAKETFIYMTPSMEVGTKKSGSFCIGGSVGDLDQCKPLKEFLEEPDAYDMYGIPTKWINETGKVGIRGLFIPAQYGMTEAVDEHGNSQVEKALIILDGLYAKWKKLPESEYLLKRSQHPRNIREAFAYRKSKYFPVTKINRRQEALKIQMESAAVKPRKGLLYRDNNNEIKLKSLKSMSDAERPQELGFPIDIKLEDKRGCVTIWEEPTNESGVYYGGVDTISGGKTDTSDSVLSVHIYKRVIEEISYEKDGKKKVSLNGGKIVASFRGRFDTVDESNEQGWMLLLYYKAFSAIERNRPNFINYGRRKGYSTYIARQNELPFFNDLKITISSGEYGVYADSGGVMRTRCNESILEYLNREIDTIHKKNTDGTVGEVVKTIRGLDMIDDYWLLEELKMYDEDTNCDAVVSAGLAISLGVSRELDHTKTVYKETEEINNDKPTIRPIYRNSLIGNNSRKKYRNKLV